MKPFHTSAFALVAALALPSLALAVDPPPGGGYANDNTALGEDALFSADLDNSITRDNTALGYESLYALTVAEDNTAVGSQSLLSLTTGGLNTAVGAQALSALKTAYSDTAVGAESLTANTTGMGNTAVGVQALWQNTTASDNTAVGQSALLSNTSGGGNTALGIQAMKNNFSGAQNTAVGVDSMEGNATGKSNTAVGYGAMQKARGNENVALGFFAGENVTGDNNIEIGNAGTGKDTKTIRIGDLTKQNRAFIAGVSGITVADGVGVEINSKGQLGVATSSARFKDDIQPMKDASDVILSLQPVTFRYKKELDSLGAPQFGLVAEQVAKVDPDLVARDDSGKPYTVRYEAVNAMLLNEFLKEHRKVEDLETTVAELKSALQAQAAQIEKVSVQVAKGREPRS